jgi:hypothetical protein
LIKRPALNTCGLKIITKGRQKLIENDDDDNTLQNWTDFNGKEAEMNEIARRILEHISCAG